jgi:hypothetical protein
LDCWVWDRADIKLDFGAICEVAVAFGWDPAADDVNKRIDPATEMEDPFYIALRCALQILEARSVGLCGATVMEHGDCSREEIECRERTLSRLGPSGIEIIRAYLDFANRKVQELAERNSRRNATGRELGGVS